MDGQLLEETELRGTYEKSAHKIDYLGMENARGFGIDKPSVQYQQATARFFQPG